MFLKYVTKTSIWSLVLALGITVPGFAFPPGPTYSVPNQGKYDPAATTFPLPSALWTVENGQRVLRYTLPLELYGTPQSPIQIELTGPYVEGNGFINMTNGHTNGTCDQMKTRVMCLVKYPFDRLSVADATSYLQATYPNDPLLQDRIGVAKAFISDPAGIVQIPFE